MKSKSGSAFARAKNRFYFRPTGRDARGEKTGGRTDRAISPHVDRSFQSCKQNLATLESWQARLSSQTNQLKTGGGSLRWLQVLGGGNCVVDTVEIAD